MLLLLIILLVGKCHHHYCCYNTSHSHTATVLLLLLFGQWILSIRVGVVWFCTNCKPSAIIERLLFSLLSFQNQNLFGTKPDDEAIDTSDVRHASIEVVTTDSLQEKFEKLDVEADLQVSVLAGMVDTSGSGAYLREQTNSGKTKSMSLLYKLKTVEDEIIMRQNKHMIDKDVLSPSEGQSIDATHVVFAIGWGAVCSVTCEYKPEEHEDVSEINEVLSAKIEKLKGLIDVNGSEESSYYHDKEEQSNKFIFKCFTDVHPPDINQPETFKVALDLTKKLSILLKSKNNGKGIPLTYTMMPLEAVMKMCKLEAQTQVRGMAIGEDIVKKCTHVVEDVRKTKLALCDIQNCLYADSNYVAQKTLDRIDYDLKMLQNDELRFKDRLQALVGKVRSGTEDAFILEKFLGEELSDTIDVSWYNDQLGGFQKDINEITLIKSWQSKGIIYIGKEEEEVNVDDKKNVYVFYKANGGDDQQKNLDKNQIFFLRLCYEHAQHDDSKFVVVDNRIREDLWPTMEKKTSIHKFVSGNQTSTDLYTEEGRDLEMCLIQIGTPVNRETGPSNRVDVELGCPNAMFENIQCSGDVVKWKCSKCKQPIQYGVDTKLFYCSCGESDPREALFRCNEKNHGMNYIKCPDDILSAELPMKEINILILGETGVGKSTWINSFINYMTFADMEDAMMAKNFPVSIPSSFTFIDQGKEKKIQIGERDANEVMEPGKSATKEPRCHSFYAGKQVINLIDTPGIGDSEGIQEDKKNFDNILSHLARYDQIHAVCILLKPNNSRLTAMFRFCIQELLAHLHSSVKDNIVFCFTNARATFYKPGDTLPTLNQELENRNVGIKATPQNYFCFDNEPFRFLACLSNGVEFGEGDIETYAGSWRKSVEETKRLFQHISTLNPHKVRNTLSMNEARRVILAMSKPLAEVAKTIQQNVQEGNEAKRQIHICDRDMGRLKASLKFSGYDLKRVELDYPRTVCADSQCVKYISIGEHGVQNTVYGQICHGRCKLTGIPTETTNDPRLQNCWCVKTKENDHAVDCHQCGHHYTKHMHITYDTKIFAVEFLDKTVQEQIYQKKSAKEQKEAFKRAIETKNTELMEEEKIIMKTSAKYGSFLKANAIIPYNDAVEDYLDMCIDQERNKAREIRNDALLSTMEDMRRQYQEERKILDGAIGSGGAENIHTAEDVMKLQEELFRLKHMGKTLKDLFDGISFSQSARRMSGNMTFKTISNPISHSLVSVVMNFFIGGYSKIKQYRSNRRRKKSP